MNISPSQLNNEQRIRSLHNLENENFDLLIIGGGINGAGIALDAASRGLKVALIEKSDLAAGTSSRSSKLIHGGLRYLEQFNFALVREALHERELMVKSLAPHLVKPVSFLYPLYRTSKIARFTEKLFVGSGLTLYDLLRGFQRELPWHRFISDEEIEYISPSLRGDLVSGAMEYFDAQVDDARHTMMVARTAAAFGAEIVTRCEAIELIKDGDSVIGCRVQDHESNKSFSVSAKVVVMSSGVWNGELSNSFGTDISYTLKPSKGVHIVLPKACINSKVGIILKTELSVLFIIPWDECWIVGTTDTPYQGDLAEPLAEQRDVDFIIDQANRVLNPKISKQDILGTFAGLRPLVSNSKNSSTTKISREHKVDHPQKGLTSLSGGKYTTYRIMSRDVVDESIKDLDIAAEVKKSSTEKIPLLGADNFILLEHKVLDFARESGLSHGTVNHLLNRYGSLIGDILEIIRKRPELGKQITPEAKYIQAEAIYAVTHEGARSVDDVISRRTRLSIELADHGVSLAPLIAQLIAPDLNWSHDQMAESVKSYQEKVAREKSQLN